jgi:hypothetical protein
MEKSNTMKSLILPVVLFFGGFANSIIIGSFIDSPKFLITATKILLPFISFLVTTRLIQARLLLKFLGRLIRRKKLINEEDQQMPKHFGYVAIPTSIFLFFVGGLLANLWGHDFLKHTMVYGVAGIIWGFVWFKMLNKDYVDLDDV